MNGRFLWAATSSADRAHDGGSCRVDSTAHAIDKPVSRICASAESPFRRSRSHVLAVAAAVTLLLAASTALVDQAVAQTGTSAAVSMIAVDYTEGDGCDDFPDLCIEKEGRLVPGDAGQWELNLVVPEGCEEPLPIFIDNPGSAWMSTDTNGTSHPMTEYCYAFAGVNDTSSGRCTFPCQTWDMNAAIRWLRANADGWTRPDDHTVTDERPAGEKYAYRLDPNRIAVSGFSSGGWQAAFEGTTNGSSFEWELPDGSVYTVDLEGTLGPWEGSHSSDVQASVPLHPPTDFSLMNPPYHGFGPPSALDHDSPDSPESRVTGCTVGDSRNDGNPLYGYDPLCEAMVQSANPIRYITPDDPPMMLFHGSSDSLVPHGQSVYLYEALRDRCNNIRFYSMDGHNHAPVYAALEPGSPLHLLRVGELRGRGDWARPARTRLGVFRELARRCRFSGHVHAGDGSAPTCG